MGWQSIIIVLGLASALSYFIPTPAVMLDSFKSGQTFFASRDYRKAIEQYDQIIETKTDFVRIDSVKVDILQGEFIMGVRTAALYQKANAYSKIGRTQEAVETYRLVEQGSDSPKIRALAQYQIYNLLYTAKDYLNAVREARLLADTYPSDEKAPQALYDVGWAYKQHNDNDSSTAAFQILVRSYPNSQFDAKARYQIGQNFFDAGEYEKSIQAFNELISIYRPEKFDSKAWENAELKAVRDRMKFEASGGREEDQSNLELVAKASVKIGDAYARRNNYDVALNQYRNVIAQYSLMPTLVEITYVKMAELALDLKGLDEAIYIYRSAIDENFGKKDLQAKLQYKIAKTYEEKENFTRAAEEYAFFMRAYPDVVGDIGFTLEQANLNAVLMYYKAHDYPHTIAYSDTFQRRFPESTTMPSILLVQGTALNAMKHYSQARTSLKKVVDNYPDADQRVQAELIIGRSYFDERDYDGTILALTPLAKTAPVQVTRDEANFFLLSSFNERSLLNEAIACFQEIPYGSVFYGPALGRVAKSYAGLKLFEDGKALLLGVRARSLEKKDSVSYLSEASLALTDIYVAESQLDSAINNLTILLNTNEAAGVVRLQTYFIRGVIYNVKGDYKSSAADLARVVENDTFKTKLTAFLPAANERLAISYIQLNDRKKAFVILQHLIETTNIPEDKARYYLTISEANFNIGEYAKGGEAVAKVLQIDSLCEETILKALSWSAKCYAGASNVEKGIDQIRIIADQHRSHALSPGYVYEFGALLYENGGIDVAARVFAIYIKTFPEGKDIKQVRESHAFCLLRLGKLDEVITVYHEMMNEASDSSQIAPLQYRIADAAYSLKDYQRAIKEYETVYREYPHAAEAAQAMYGKAWSYFQLQLPDSMALVLEEMTKQYPKSEAVGDALFTLGDYYYNNRMYSEASRSYSRIVNDYPQYRRVEEAKNLVKELSQIAAFIEYEKAMVLFDNKDYKAAIVEMDKIVKKYQSGDVVLAAKANVASAYEQLGQMKKAREEFKKIADQHRDLPEAFDVVIFAEQHIKWIDSRPNLIQQ